MKNWFVDRQVRTIAQRSLHNETMVKALRFKHRLGSCTKKARLDGRAGQNHQSRWGWRFVHHCAEALSLLNIRMLKRSNIIASRDVRLWGAPSKLKLVYVAG